MREDTLLEWKASAPPARYYTVFFWPAADARPTEPLAEGWGRLDVRPTEPDGKLERGATYKWQVIAHSSPFAPGVTGPEWRFTVRGIPKPFVRGDVEADGSFRLADAIKILSVLFLGGSEFDCEKSADIDDSGVIQISDAISLLNYLFLGGDPPLPPLEGCGNDPTEDDLGCEVSRACK